MQLGRSHIADVDDRMVSALGEQGYDSLRHGLEMIVKVLQADGAPSD